MIVILLIIFIQGAHFTEGLFLVRARKAKQNQKSKWINKCVIVILSKELRTKIRYRLKFSKTSDRLKY